MSRAHYVTLAFGIAIAAVIIALAVQRQRPTITVTLPPSPDSANPQGSAAPRVADAECKALLDDYGAENPQDPQQLCQTIREIIIKNHPASSRELDKECGGSEIVQTLRKLYTCALVNGQCNIGKGERIVVDFNAILEVSRRFPLFISFFATGEAVLANTMELQNFVEGEIGQETMDFLVFGSASPTGRTEKVDHEIARQRALKARETINQILMDHHKMEPDIRQANVGRTLAADYCVHMNDESRKACEARDENARRQAAFVLAYPKKCRLASTADATAPASHASRTQ